MLQRVRREQAERRLLLGTAWRGAEHPEDDYVFDDGSGAMLDPDWIAGNFRRLARRAELPTIRFHDLRHGHVNLLLGRGVDVKTISARLGHASVSTTLDIYADQLPALDATAAATLDDVLAANSP